MCPFVCLLCSFLFQESASLLFYRTHPTRALLYLLLSIIIVIVRRSSTLHACKLFRIRKGNSIKHTKKKNALNF